MFQKCHFSILIVILFLSFNSVSSYGQSTPRSLLWEPEFNLSIPSNDQWNFTFGVANRYLFYTELEGERVDENEQQHIEINHFTNYKTSESTSISIGFRYRFRETFESGNHDEFRTIQQFSHKLRGVLFTPAHRIRFEQRFRENTTFRFRYRLGASQPLGEDFGVGLSTEFLYSLQQDKKPAFEQRFTLKLENSSINNIKLSTGIELRRENYTGAPSSGIYILSGATIEL